MEPIISGTSSAGGSHSVDSLSRIEKYVIDSNEKTAECKEKAKVITENEDEFNRVVKDQYLKNVSEMTNFCSDLHKFVTAACDSQLCIKDLIEQIEMEDDRSERDVEELIHANVRMARYMQISEILHNLKSSTNDICIQNLKQTIKALLIQHEEMMASLQDQNLDQKYSSSRAWRKAAKVILMVTQAVLLVISTLARTGMIGVSPMLTMMDTVFHPIVTTMYQMVVPWIEEYEISIEARSDLMKPMRKGIERASAELDDLRDTVGLVVNEIDSLLRRVKFKTSGQSESTTMKGIKEKLEKFQDKINDLKDQTKKCGAEMKNARDKVLEGFGSESPKKN